MPHFLDIKDLNMLVMNEGASHRLAAIHQYINDKKTNSIKLNAKHIKFAKINLELLKKYKIDKTNKKVFYLNADRYKEIKQLDLTETLKLIETLQIIYLGKVNKLTFINKIQYKFFYKCRPMNTIEKAQERLNNLH